MYSFGSATCRAVFLAGIGIRTTFYIVCEIIDQSNGVDDGNILFFFQIITMRNGFG